jgi:hypothetical protein
MFMISLSANDLALPFDDGKRRQETFFKKLFKSILGSN